MDLVEAHERFAARKDRSIVPGTATALSPDGEEVDFWPALAAGLADLSGWLEDAEDDADLDDAARQGLSLVGGGVVSGQDVGLAAARVIVELIRWGDDACSDCSGRG
jgi:hypothetical protein